MAKLRSGAALRDAMEAGRIGMDRLSSAVGCSKGFISHLVAERRTGCTDNLAARISEALGVDCGVLFQPRDAIASSEIRAEHGGKRC